MENTSTQPVLKKSIARQLVVSIVLFSSCITLITTAIQISIDYRHDINSIQHKFIQIEESYLSSIRSSLWSYDHTQTKTILQGIVSLRDIEFVQVMKGRQEIASVGQPVTNNALHWNKSIFHAYEGQNVYLGEVKASASLDGVYARLWTKVWVILLGNGVKTFAVSIFIFLLFRYLVTRHLHTLAHHVNTNLLAKDAPTLKLDRAVSKSREDELDTVVNAINTMQTQLNDLFLDLQEKEQRFKDFAEASSDWFWEMNDKLEFTYISPGYHEITGDDPNFYIGKKRNFVTTESTYEKKWAEHQDRLDRHKPFRDFTYHLKKTDGTGLTVRVNGIPKFNKKGVFTGYRGSASDISNLEHLEDQVRRSQKMEAVGQLTGGIAHDFNNVLGIIMGNLELIQRSVSGDEQIPAFAAAAYKGARRGADLNKKLLGFSRKSTHKEQRISINDFILGIEDLITKSLTVSIHTTTTLAENLWPVSIDPGDLEDVILNLSLNARDAMPHGGELIIETCNKVLDDNYVQLNPQATAGEYVMLSVSDTGHGMSTDIKDRVLEPFFTTKEESKGTGLGLSMVYGFVQRSSGHIAIYSEVGHGSSFQIYLPRAEKLNASKSTSETTPHLPRGVETILVVDDEEALTDIAVSQLQDLGYSTLTAQNSAQALTIIKENPNINLLFSDVIMPGELDGYQLALAVHKAYPALKVLLTSGFTKKREEIINKDHSLHTNLLSKPYNQSELAAAIRKALDQAD
ncbi:MAG: hypothetical protein COB46_07240 [Rhodospirillaceae bacterium]|nr:MAG: hypothetical protein COB46_07240 [Rhodospirillaceae bacterium]